MTNEPKPHDMMVATVTISHTGAHLATVPGRAGQSLTGLMAESERISPSGTIVIRGAYTSDGTFWGPGKGRVMARRESGRWLVG